MSLKPEQLQTESLLDQVRARGAFVVQNAEHVAVDAHKIAAYAAMLLKRYEPCRDLDQPYHFDSRDEAALSAYVVALDSINFGSGYFDHLKKRPGLCGYRTVAQSLKDHFLVRPMGAAEMAVMTAETCAGIFGQGMADPVIAELMTLFAGALNETGSYIMEYHDGDVLAFIQTGGHSAAALVAELSRLPKFHDVTRFRHLEIPVYKRAQILTGDLYLAFRGQGAGAFHDIDRLTSFADNVIPHVLRHDGILRYDPALAEKIDAGVEIAAGSGEEAELRCCAIHAVELITAAARERGFNVNAMNIDHILWGRGHEDFFRALPRHKTRTVFY